MIMLKNAATQWIGRAARGAALAFLASTAAAAATSATYPNMAPAAQYMIANPADEIALARSAAPPSISKDAAVLVLGPHGYMTAAKGTNGFVCLVERSWDAGFDDPVFWNPNIRGADCLNPAAAESVLPHFMERARWALGGVSKADMIAKTKTEVAMGAYPMPASGAMAFMMSKNQYLSDSAVHHWHPHLMFFIANAKDASWGANLDGSPVLTAPNSTDPFTTFFVPVGKWSDGTPYEAPPMKMN
jgi:hypothetical protein